MAGARIAENTTNGPGLMNPHKPENQLQFFGLADTVNQNFQFPIRAFENA